ncbi:hypothetical protein KSF73_13420 [Burkholderiaceae bacterium DAT-1]|nr:hypothetical protein [Burkholderiaceae bacterium DAT-1]
MLWLLFEALFAGGLLIVIVWMTLPKAQPASDTSDDDSMDAAHITVCDQQDSGDSDEGGSSDTGDSGSDSSRQDD